MCSFTRDRCIVYLQWPLGPTRRRGTSLPWTSSPAPTVTHRLILVNKSLIAYYLSWFCYENYFSLTGHTNGAHSLLAPICCSSVALREVTPHCREGFLCFVCSEWEALLTFLGVRFRVDEHPEIYQAVPPKKENHSWYMNLNHLLQWSTFVAVAVTVIYMFKCKQVTSSQSYLSIWKNFNRYFCKYFSVPSPPRDSKLT